MKNLAKILLLFFIPLFSFAQTIDLDGALADDHFRSGVSAFQNGFYNKAYMSFEAAITLKPERHLYSYWLAEAYYRNGYNSAASQIWQQLIDQNYQVDLLTSKVEQSRRMLAPAPTVATSAWTLSNEIFGAQNGVERFAGPVAVTPDLRGGLWITSYLTGEIIYFDANAKLLQGNYNGVKPFSKIFDLLITPNNDYFATELGANRFLKFDTDFIKGKGFGQKGRDASSFNGPQFICYDSSNYLYITDVGNCRVAKYSVDGKLILTFGEAKGQFNGLKFPTGICAIDDKIFVADRREKVIYYFDQSGNFMGEVARGKLLAPEGLSAISSGEILVADTTRVVLVDIELDGITVLNNFNNLAKKIVNVDIDINGNIVASDFTKNSIYYLTDKSLLYSGLYLQVENINAAHFPKVMVDFTVKDSIGRPFCGLDTTNFNLVENGAYIANHTLRYADIDSNEVSVALLLDRSSDVTKEKDQLEITIKTLFSSLVKGDQFYLISEDEQPILQDEVFFKSKKDLSKAESFLSSIFEPKTAADENGRFDLGLRESVNRLLNHRGKKAVVYITDSNLDNDDFSAYNLNRLENYLRNNNIIFYLVQVTPKNGSGFKDLEYLVRKSGGKYFSVYDPTGVKDLIPSLRSSRSGRYVLEYESVSNGNFGRDYIELAIEASHFNRSGKIVHGYFSPLDFKRK